MLARNAFSKAAEVTGLIKGVDALGDQPARSPLLRWGPDPTGSGYRMFVRRLTRLTIAFSKKWDNLKAALALYFAYYNFCRIHKTIKMTPAMAAGITNHVWT